MPFVLGRLSFPSRSTHPFVCENSILHWNFDNKFSSIWISQSPRLPITTVPSPGSITLFPLYIKTAFEIFCYLTSPLQGPPKNLSWSSGALDFGESEVWLVMISRPSSECLSFSRKFTTMKIIPIFNKWFSFNTYPKKQFRRDSSSFHTRGKSSL